MKSAFSILSLCAGCLAAIGCSSDFEPAGFVVPQGGSAGAVASSGGGAGAIAGAGSSAASASAGASSAGATSSAGTGSAGTGSAQLPGATDFPCAVLDLLRARCHECHGYPIRGGAPMRLLTRADLLAPSLRDASQRNVDRMLVRMADGSAPMPPAPRAMVSDAERAALQTWVDEGTPDATCMDAAGAIAVPDGGLSPVVEDPAFAAREICTSNHYWDDGNDGSRRMHPGVACVTCHQRMTDEETPRFAIGGTVFPTAHEPDDCNGIDGQRDTDMFVVITDASGKELRLEVNDVGNFHSNEDGDQLTFPIRAKVVRGTRERVMAGERMTGDCNSCHTQRGENGAPGRIVAP